MEIIAITSGTGPSVLRPQGSTSVFLALRGVRDTSEEDDQDTRVRIMLAAREAARIWRILGQILTEAEKADDSDSVVGAPSLALVGAEHAEPAGRLLKLGSELLVKRNSIHRHEERDRRD
jgi:hypothetical protein